MNVVLRNDGFSYDVYEIKADKPDKQSIAYQINSVVELTPPQQEKLQYIG